MVINISVEHLDNPEDSSDEIKYISSMIADVIELIKTNKILQLPDRLTVSFSENDTDADCALLNMGCYDPEDQTVILSIDFPETLIEVLVHELVHAEQYHLGWLDSDEDYFYWFGTRFVEPEDVKGYKNLPWERDAFRREKEIMKEITPWLAGLAAINDVNYEQLLQN